MKCDCNIFKLSEGSKQLQILEQNNIYDYMYLKCCICDKFGDYFNENYTFCVECGKEYCDKCKCIESLQTIKKCICNVSNLDITTYEKCKDCKYYYCMLCKLSNCLYCNADNDNNNCPKCEQRIIYNNVMLCQTHYDIK